MARAKRTDRTDARRRNRAEQTALTGEIEAGAASTSSGTSRSTSGAPRPSIIGSLRGAFRPLDLRGDLRSLPQLLVHWSFFGPAAGTLASTIAFITLSQGRTTSSPTDTVWTISFFAFQMFVFPLPAPAGAAFIGGFGARRASWLVGLLLGVLAAICFAVIVYSVPSFILFGGTTASTPDAQQSYALQGILVAPVGSALFAAAAAWYKRFLNLANPNRNQRRGGQGKASQPKPVQGRGNITRDRLSR